jgi:hypothetical protein
MESECSGVVGAECVTAAVGVALSAGYAGEIVRGSGQSTAMGGCASNASSSSRRVVPPFLLRRESKLRRLGQPVGDRSPEVHSGHPAIHFRVRNGC